MERILTSIDLSAEIRIALGSRQGALGKSLALVEAYERGAWEKANELASACGISDSILPQIYLESLQWATHRLHG